MSTFVDGFVFPIPLDHLDEYQAMAEASGKIWLEHGALGYWECIGEDLEVPDQISFPDLAAAGPDETVGFSWIVFKSKEHRDEVTALVMADPRMEELHDADNLPLDPKRMAHGGFRPIVQMGK